MKIKNRLNKKINKIFKKIVDKLKSSVVLFNQDKGIKTKGRLKMMTLNLAQLKVSKNTKSHIWNRHHINKKRVLYELTHGILDAIQEDEERIAVFTKNYFILIVDINMNLVTAFQSNPKQYKKYLEKFSK